MPGEVIDRPNPPPDPSQLPDSLLSLAVQLETINVLDEKQLAAVQKFRRCADYIAAGMLEFVPSLLYHN